MQLISQGAEAKLYREGNILVKDRLKKQYRIPEIDDKLRTTRTRREAKILEKLAKMKFPVPKLVKVGREKIEMEFLKGPKVRDILEKSDYLKLSKEIGKKIADLHNAGIIHGDLTTSNMILEDEAYFIDFGLSFFSARLEDKAVDLHLLRQALESKHYKIWEQSFRSTTEEYLNHAKDGKEILERLEEGEERGRNKKKH